MHPTCECFLVCFFLKISFHHIVLFIHVFSSVHSFVAAGSASTFFPSLSNLVMVSAPRSGQTLVRLMGVCMNDGGGVEGFRH